MNLGLFNILQIIKCVIHVKKPIISLFNYASHKWTHLNYCLIPPTQ